MAQFLARWMGWVVAAVLAIMLGVFFCTDIASTPDSKAALIGAALGAAVTVLAAQIATALEERGRVRVILQYYASGARDLLEGLESAHETAMAARPSSMPGSGPDRDKLNEARKTVTKHIVSARKRLERSNPEFFRLSAEAISSMGSLESAASGVAPKVEKVLGEAVGPDAERGRQAAISALEELISEVRRIADRLDSLARDH